MLRHYVMSGAYEHVKRALEENSEYKLDYLDGLSRTLLILALDRGYADIAQLLIAKGAAVNIRSYQTFETPLITAVKMGDLTTVQHLLAAGANVHATDRFGMNSLMWAYKSGFSDLKELLLANGARFSVKDYEAFELRWNSLDVIWQKFGYEYSSIFKKRHAIFVEIFIKLDLQMKDQYMPLLNAIRCDQSKRVNQLLEAGADIHALSEEGNSALMLGVSMANKEILLQLLAKGADIEARNGLWGRTALMLAARNGNIEFIRILLEHGANIQAMSNMGTTALMEAVILGQQEAIALLLAAGAKVNAKDENGWTALMFAAYLGHTSIVSMLLANKAEVNASSYPKETALMLAAEKGQSPVVNLLLCYGADHALINPKHMNALLLAAREGYPEIISSLLRYGADMHSKDLECNNAFFYAAVHGHKAVLKLLLNAGLDINERQKYVESTTLMNVMDIFNQPQHERWVVRNIHSERLSVACLKQAASLLLKYGADLSARDYAGKLAMDYVGDPEIKVWLIAEDSRLRRRHLVYAYACIQKFHALTRLIRAGKVAEFLTYLNASFLPINYQEKKSGNTLLHYAAAHGEALIMRSLLEKGADPSIKNQTSLRAYELLV